jgi:hypothetical protein
MATRTDWHEPLVRRLIECHGGLAPETIVERYADRLRDQADQHALPIAPSLIASVTGIRRRTGSFEFAGRIYAEENGQLVMDVNVDDSFERQHFTEAHELIHTAFPGFKTEKRYRRDGALMERHPPNQEEEYLCDVGAAALLMPAALVQDHYSVAAGMADAERLSADAEVSVEAAANRLVTLADEPALLLCLRYINKPADAPAQRRGEVVEPRWRVSYAAGSSHIRFYVPRFKSVEEGSVLSEAASTWTMVSGEEPLPGAARDGQFRLTAKRYGSDHRARVLAIARPTA